MSDLPRVSSRGRHRPGKTHVWLIFQGGAVKEVRGTRPAARMRTKRINADNARDGILGPAYCVEFEVL